jgi:twitching motility protein PilT
LAKRLITSEEALGRSSDPEELRNIIASGIVANRPAGGTAAGGR